MSIAFLLDFPKIRFGLDPVFLVLFEVDKARLVLHEMFVALKIDENGIKLGAICLPRGLE